MRFLPTAHYRFPIGLTGLGSFLLVIFYLTLDPRIRGLLINTFYLGFGTVAVSLPLGTFLAVFIVKTDLPGRRLLIALLTGMLLIPLFAVAVAWEAVLGGTGWWAQVATLACTEVHFEPWLSGWRGAILVHGFAAVPWVTLIVGTGLRTVAGELEEDALLDTSPAHVIWRVSLRHAAPSLGVAALWVGIAAAGEMAVTDLFRIRTFAEEVYVQAAVAPFDLTSQPLAPGWNTVWAGCGFGALLFVAALIVCRRWMFDIRSAWTRPCHRFPLTRKSLPLIGLVHGTVFLLIGVPAGSLFYLAGVGVRQIADRPVPTWSAIQTVRLVAASPSEHARELTASIQTGMAVSCAATLTAILLVWWARRGGWRFGLMVVIAAICLMVPGPLLGLATIRLLNRPPDSVFAWLAWLNDRTWIAPWIVQTVRVLPLSILVLWPALNSISPTLLDAATIDRANKWQRLVFVALPQRMGACALSLIVCFATAIGELAATVLVYPPGTTPISVQIFNMLHYGVDDRLAALVLFLFIATLLAGIAITHLWRRNPRATSTSPFR